MPNPSSVTTAIPLTISARATKSTAPTSTSVSTVRESTLANSATIVQNKVSQNKMLKNLQAHPTNQHPCLSKKDKTIITPIRVDKLSNYLEGYDSALTSFLIQGLLSVLKFHIGVNVHFGYRKTSRLLRVMMKFFIVSS